MSVWPKHPRLRIDFKSDALWCKMNVVEFLFSLPNFILNFFFFYFECENCFILFISPCPVQLDFMSKYKCINIFFISRLCQIEWYFRDFVSLKVNHWKQLVLPTLQNLGFFWWKMGGKRTLATWFLFQLQKKKDFPHILSYTFKWQCYLTSDRNPASFWPHDSYEWNLQWQNLKKQMLGIFSVRSRRWWNVINGWVRAKDKRDRSQRWISEFAFQPRRRLCLSRGSDNESSIEWFSGQRGGLLLP